MPDDAFHHVAEPLPCERPEVLNRDRIGVGHSSQRMAEAILSNNTVTEVLERKGGGGVLDPYLTVTFENLAVVSVFPERLVTARPT